MKLNKKLYEKNILDNEEQTEKIQISSNDENDVYIMHESFKTLFGNYNNVKLYFSRENTDMIVVIRA